MDTTDSKGNSTPANNDARLPDVVHQALAQATLLQTLRGIGQLFRWSYAWKFGIDDPTQATADFGAFEAAIHPLPGYVVEYCEYLMVTEYPNHNGDSVARCDRESNVHVLPARPGAKIVKLDTSKKRK